jgi:hypothetical protein
MALDTRMPPTLVEGGEAGTLLRMISAASEKRYTERSTGSRSGKGFISIKSAFQGGFTRLNHRSAAGMSDTSGALLNRSKDISIEES